MALQRNPDMAPSYVDRPRSWLLPVILAALFGLVLLAIYYPNNSSRDGDTTNAGPPVKTVNPSPSPTTAPPVPTPTPTTESRPTQAPIP